MPHCTGMESFSKNVRAVLRSRNITLRAFSAQVGIAHSNLSRILNGHEGVTLERAERIAKHLRVPLSELISEKFKISSAQVLR